MQWQELFIALALVMVWEGLMPSINPSIFRKMLENVIKMSDKSLRTMGLSSMLIGAVLVYLIKQ